MTMEELLNLLETTGMPVAYREFKSSPEPPYIIYLFAYSSNFGADNKVHSKVNNYQVELYTKDKEPETEEILENILDNASIFYNKVESYIESEEINQILYEISV